MVFKGFLQTISLVTGCEIAQKWMTQSLSDKKSILVSSSNYGMLYAIYCYIGLALYRKSVTEQEQTENET